MARSGHHGRCQSVILCCASFSASQLNALREESFTDYPKLKADYFAEFEQAEGTQNFLNAQINYPLLKGTQTNLYKCFFTASMDASSQKAWPVFTS